MYIVRKISERLFKQATCNVRLTREL